MYPKTQMEVLSLQVATPICQNRIILGNSRRHGLRQAKIHLYKTGTSRYMKVSTIAHKMLISVSFPVSFLKCKRI